MLPLHIRMAQAANTALRDNAAVRNASDLWSLSGARAKQCAEDWSREGIPENVILDAIGDVCKRFQPTKENPRIGSFRYFHNAVHKAWAAMKQGDALDEAFASLE